MIVWLKTGEAMMDWKSFWLILTVALTILLVAFAHKVWTDRKGINKPSRSEVLQQLKDKQHAYEDSAAIAMVEYEAMEREYYRPIGDVERDSLRAKYRRIITRQLDSIRASQTNAH